LRAVPAWERPVFRSPDQLEEESNPLKTRNILLSLALLAVLVVLAVSQLNTPVNAPDAELVDMGGREVKLAVPAKRLIALQPADCEILFSIGAGVLLVGRGAYAAYPEEVLAVPSVQSGFETNLEQIIALKPDAVVMATMNQREEDVKKLEEAGIAVIISDAQTIEQAYSVIQLLGRITGYEDNARKIVREMKASFAALKEKVGDRRGGSIYFEVSPLEYGLWAAGSGTFMDEIGQLLNLNNAFADIQGWKSISEEQVIARSPDIIVTTAMYSGAGPTPIEEMLARPNWGAVKAISEKKVFQAAADAITQPGPRLVQAAEALYHFVYGD
jgi:iron complex transport system substrate-binding protein